MNSSKKLLESKCWCSPSILKIATSSWLMFMVCDNQRCKRLKVTNSFVAVRNRYTSRFTAASIWEILSLIVLLTRDPRRTRTHQLAEHEDCIEGEQKICSQISGTTYTNCDTLGVSGSSCYKILKTTEKSPKYNSCK